MAEAGKYLKVRNWEKFQAFKDGRPMKWIKVETRILDDYEFNQLPEIDQLHLKKIWLLAAKLGNKIPNDPVFIAQRIGAKENINLHNLLEAGYLQPYESVRNRTNPYLEKRRVEKSREEIDPLASLGTLFASHETIRNWISNAHPKQRLPEKGTAGFMEERKSLALLVTRDGYSEDDVLNTFRWVFEVEPQPDDINAFSLRRQIRSIKSVRRNWKSDGTAFAHCYDAWQAYSGTNHRRATADDCPV